MQVSFELQHELSIICFTSMYRTSYVFWNTENGISGSWNIKIAKDSMTNASVPYIVGIIALLFLISLLITSSIQAKPNHA